MSSWKRQPSLVEKLAVMAGSWFVPGLGFWLKGARWQALSLFILIEFVFVVGLLLNGGVLVPGTFNPVAPGANIVGILTFFVQCFNGGGLIASLLLPCNETAAYHDLGCFWLMTSAGMNYFAMLGIWDSYYAAPQPTPVIAPKVEES